MKNQTFDILNQTSRWLHDGYQVLLVTVIETWGSSPRPSGSLMAMREDGQIIGSVSGGCIEDDLITRITQNDLPETPEFISYGEEESRRFGLPCGGTMRLLQEPLKTADEIDNLLGKLANRQTIARVLDLNTGLANTRLAQQNEVLTCDDKQLTSIFGPQYRLLIIGAGQLSSLLAEIVLSMDFSITICDPRSEYYEQWKVDGTNLVTTMPDDTVINMQVDSLTAVVTLTHDPKLDDMALLEALKSPAFYIAALGSKLSNEKRRERLKLFDLNEQQISRLSGPAGISIGSKTPAEIAISIAAELVAVKNRVIIND